MILYDRCFLHKPKSCFLFVNLFSEKFSVVFATEQKWQRPWLLKAPKVGRSYIDYAIKTTWIVFLIFFTNDITEVTNF